KGFRNVPRTALFGANLQSPANTGIETYFWDRPAEDPVAAAQTKEAVVTITPWPRSAEAAEGAAANAGTFANVLRFLLVASVLIGLALLALRHPLISRRLLLMIPTMLIVSIIVFILVQLPPGDFAQMRVTRLEMEGTSATEELAAELRRNFRLDEPMWQRYVRWMG